jgi:hypothetical protein
MLEQFVMIVFIALLVWVVIDQLLLTILGVRDRQK